VCRSKSTLTDLRTSFLAFAAACALGSAYGFLQGAWPFGVVEAIWCAVALRRFLARRRAERSGMNA